MTIEGLLVALIFIAIICVIGRVVIGVMKPPAESSLPAIVWAVVTVVCLLILLGAVTGHQIVQLR